MKIRCEWCLNPNADYANYPDLLCDDHAAEYEGISVSELYRRDTIWAFEEYDTTH